MSTAHDDYDSPWKNALEEYFEEFMQLFFPDTHADIDWSRPIEFMDKELQQVALEAEVGRRYADKLAKVERFAMQKGEDKGRDEGLKEGQREGAVRLLLHLLTHRFGEVPEMMQARVQP